MTGTAPPLAAPPPPAHLHPRIVPWRHALAWYEDAMRLFKRAPLTWVALAVVTLLAEIALKALPGAGSLAGEVVTPLFACGLLLAAAAADRGEAPTISLALRAFRAPPGTIAAIVISALVATAAEAAAAWWLADVNLFALGSAATELTPLAIAGIYTIGILASLPVMFVAFHVLLERVAPAAAFAASWQAFTLNTFPLLVYSAVALALLGFGVATMGLGLMLALPLWAASSYAAWKDIFGVRDPPAAP